MGFFSHNETCCICNQNVGNKKIANGMICQSCLSKCGIFIPLSGLKAKSSEYILQAMQLNERNIELRNLFHSTKNIQKYIDIDENNKIWGIPCFNPHLYFTYDDIASFELLENGNSITKGGLGSAVVGGALFGGVGAIVGSNVGKKRNIQEITLYTILIGTRNPVYKTITIDFLKTGKIMSDSCLYASYSGSAKQIISLLTRMTAESNPQPVNASYYSPADEIVKYKKLLDDGIITQEEFDRKKQQLLDS